MPLIETRTNIFSVGVRRFESCPQHHHAPSLLRCFYQVFWNQTIAKQLTEYAISYRIKVKKERSTARDIAEDLGIFLFAMQPKTKKK
jgi:hypothetical protein